MESTSSGSGPDQKPPAKTKRCPGELTAGLILVGLGLVFLLHQFDILRLRQGWPLILIAVGLALVAGTLLRKI